MNEEERKQVDDQVKAYEALIGRANYLAEVTDEGDQDLVAAEEAIANFEKDPSNALAIEVYRFQKEERRREREFTKRLFRLGLIKQGR